LERIKTKERWLRDEIRASRQIILGVMKWGVTVLTATGALLYYIRRDVANRMFTMHTLPQYGTVPPARWLVGTAFLAMIAFIYCIMTRYVVKRHVGYRSQLLDMDSYSGIEEGPTGGKINNTFYFLFYAFPAFDLILWFYFRAISSITIPW
jgi:hypothetical protein